MICKSSCRISQPSNTWLMLAVFCAPPHVAWGCPESPRLIGDRSKKRPASDFPWDIQHKALLLQAISWKWASPMGPPEETVVDPQFFTTFTYPPPAFPGQNVKNGIVKNQPQDLRSIFPPGGIEPQRCLVHGRWVCRAFLGAGTWRLRGFFLGR